PLTIPWMNSTNIQATLSMPFRNAVKLMLESNAKLPARLLMRLAEDAATRSKPSAAANAPKDKLNATIIGVTGASNVAATPNVARARAMDIKDLAKDPMLNSPILANASAKTFIAAAITKIDADDAKPPFMRFKATTNSVSAIAIAPNDLARVSRSSAPSSFIGSTSKFIAADITVTATAERKSTRLNSSHVSISYAVFSLNKKKNI